MKRWTMVGLLTFGVGLIAGCEWNSGGGASDFNDRWNFINWSGVYRAIDGGPVVSDFTGSSGEIIPITGERVAEGDGVATAFAGSLDHTDVVVSSVTITTPGFTFKDTDGDGTLTGSPKGSGTIIYSTGAWTLDFAGSAIGFGVDIVASYSYAISGTSAGPGTSGGRLDSLTVFQEGERLTITDNLGATYEGKLGSTRSTGGIDQDDGILVANSDVISEFSVQGTTKAGFSATIVGTFSGAVNSEGNTLAQRLLEGTFIEDGGMTGDIRASAPSVGISQELTTTTEEDSDGTATTTTGSSSL